VVGQVSSVAQLQVKKSLHVSRVPLANGAITIGRGSTNAVVLPHASISREHCAVEYDGGAVRVRDLGSRNGTLLNGAPVTEGILNPGDRIGVGPFEIIYLDQGNGTVAGLDVANASGTSLRTKANGTRVPVAEQSSASLSPAAGTNGDPSRTDTTSADLAKLRRDLEKAKKTQSTRTRRLNRQSRELNAKQKRLDGRALELDQRAAELEGRAAEFEARSAELDERAAAAGALFRGAGRRARRSRRGHRGAGEADDDGAGEAGREPRADRVGARR
jgi:predicted component of type VI protein secretion system